ncbi:c-type cytochrome [Nitrospina sp. 32_T5]|uniref:c-type cytochrome n=1 Tax=unclassified Nitrospina TaxID=2638683 RepID=UPI003F9C8846
MQVLELVFTALLLVPAAPPGLTDMPGHSGICPQTRQTPTAPQEYLDLENPLEPTEANILAGKTLFHFDAEPHACRVCHGLSGNGLGIMFKAVHPKPRNFTCFQTMKDLPDGQLFWVIRNGSPGTVMPAFGSLDVDQIWQLILYIRNFSKVDSTNEQGEP